MCVRYPSPAMVRSIPFGAALCALTTFVAAQDVVTCRACNNHGSFACSKHGKLFAQEEGPGTKFCSVATECKACGGALAVDCKQCVNPSVESALAERQRLAREWLDKRRKAVDETVGNRTLLHLETPHVDLVFSIRPLMVGKEKLDTHTLMHLYGERLEAFRTLYQQTLELTDTEMPGRLRVYLFRDQHDHGIVGPRETGFGNAGAVGLKQMGPEFVYSMWQEPRSVPDDEALHRNVVHHVTHLLNSEVLPVMFIGNKGHGWIDEGLAHWFEDKVTGRCLNYCFEEVLTQPMADWKGGRWRTPVRQLLDAGKLPTFASFASQNTDQLTFEGHAMAFAYVDFLIATKGGAKMRDLLRGVKKGQPSRDVLQAVYGWNPLTIEAPFQQWVKDTYPPVSVR